MGALGKVTHGFGILVALVSVFGCLAVGPIIMSLVVLPGYWLGGRPTGVLLACLNKKLHCALVHIFYRIFGVQMLLYGHDRRGR